MFPSHHISIESSIPKESPAECPHYRAGKCGAKHCTSCHETRLSWGAAAVALYGLGSVFIGFGVSTAAFLVTWMLLANSRIAVPAKFLGQEQER